VQRLPLLANKEEWSRITPNLQQIPGDGNFGEGAETTIKGNQKINFGELAQSIKEIGAVALLGDVAIRRETVP
jgi:hypothetical protein